LHQRELGHDIKRKQKLALSNDMVLARAFIQGDVETTEMVNMYSGHGGHESSSQIVIISQPMILRVAAKHELNAYFAIDWFNDVALGMEIDQARSSLLLSFSTLAACTHSFITLLGGPTVYTDTKLQKILPSRLGIIPHRGSWKNLDPTAPYR
jgi:hypothetical protein